MACSISNDGAGSSVIVCFLLGAYVAQWFALERSALAVGSHRPVHVLASFNSKDEDLCGEAIYGLNCLQWMMSSC